MLVEGAKVTRSALFAAYKQRATAQGEDDDAVLSNRIFTEKVREHGCEEIVTVRSAPTGPGERG